MRIVVLDGYCLNPGDISWAPFEKLGELTVYERTSLTDEEEIAGRIAGAEVVLTNKTPLTRAVLERCPHLRYVGVLATGYNVVDIESARQRGIPVCNVPSYGTRAVAQFAIALLLELCHHVGGHDQAVHEGAWSRCPDYCFWNWPLVELAGKTMGIVGYGRRIGHGGHCHRPPSLGCRNGGGGVGDPGSAAVPGRCSVPPLSPDGGKPWDD